MKQHSRKYTAGFSLIEVIVGIAILGIITVPVCASLVLSMRINAAGRSLMTAQLEASAAVETLMAEGIREADFHTNAEGKPERQVNGARVLIENRGSVYYDVTVIGEDNGKTVTLTTSIRVQEGGGT